MKTKITVSGLHTVNKSEITLNKQLSMIFVMGLVDNEGAKIINIYGASGNIVLYGESALVIWDGEHIGTINNNRKPIYFDKNKTHADFRKYLREVLHLHKAIFD